MKRITACIFALIFWTVLLCTAFSFRIKEWMTPQVVTTSVGYSSKTDENTLPVSAVVTDELGPHLYQIVEGGEYDANTRVQEYPTDKYAAFPDRIVMIDGWGMNPFVEFATRPLKEGEAVELLKKPLKKDDDIWVISFPEEVPLMESQNPKVATIEDQAEGAFLVRATGAEQPFAEAKAKTYLTVTPPDATGDPLVDAFLAQNMEYHVYSFSEIRRFFEAVPMLSLIGSLLLFSVGLWIASCLLSKGGKRGKRLIAVNAFFAAVLFVGIVLLLRRIDLPSSLLPTQTILEIDHYTGEFGDAFRALNTLSQVGNPAARDILSVIGGNLRLSLLFPVIGLLGSVALILLELRLRRPRKRGAGRHGARQ